jgi:hypothetical protein
MKGCHVCHRKFDTNIFWQAPAKAENLTWFEIIKALNMMISTTQRNILTQCGSVSMKGCHAYATENVRACDQAAPSLILIYNHVADYITSDLAYIEIVESEKYKIDVYAEDLYAQSKVQVSMLQTLTSSLQSNNYE